MKKTYLSAEIQLDTAKWTKKDFEVVKLAYKTKQDFSLVADITIDFKILKYGRGKVQLPKKKKKKRKVIKYKFLYLVGYTDRAGYDCYIKIEVKAINSNQAEKKVLKSLKKSIREKITGLILIGKDEPIN